MVSASKTTCGLFLSLISVGFQSTPLQAETFEAICDGSPCKIVLDARGISGSGIYLPVNNIARWSRGGEEGYNMAQGAAAATGVGVLGAVAGTVALGAISFGALAPLGFVGGLAGGGHLGAQSGKTADLYFSVIGYGVNGKKQIMGFSFQNPKPARKIANQLAMFTGLPQDATRPIADLKKAVQSLKRNGSSEFLPESLDYQDAGVEPFEEDENTYEVINR